MDIELTTNNLRKLCRACLNDGELNIWDYKVVLPEKEGFSHDEILVAEMIKTLDATQQNILELGEELTMLCHKCLNKLSSYYIFHRQFLNANKTIIRLYKEAYKIESDIDNGEIEYLENSTDICEDVNDSAEEVDEMHDSDEDFLNDKYNDLYEDELNVKSELKKTLKQPLKQAERCISKRQKSNKYDKPIVLNKLQKKMSHSSIKHKPEVMEEASLVITQFVPSDKQVKYTDADTGLEQEYSTTESLRTVDFTTVEVTGANLRKIVENIPNASISDNDNGDNQHIYVCKYCPQAFSSPHYLIVHTRKCHVCKYCTQAFNKTTDLYEHIKKSHQTHKCAICSKEISSNNNLRNHIKRIHGIVLPPQCILLNYRPSRKDEVLSNENKNCEPDHYAESNAKTQEDCNGENCESQFLDEFVEYLDES